MVKTKQVVFDENIIDTALDEVMHSAFMTYAEYVTMERALPRVEDGLKPVQRRILYTLNELGITPDKPYKKSARIVGETLGKYHPHGDISVYDAMVRLAQEFVMRMPLIDGHGNFGSPDGDSPAAMRYTEVRMSPLAMEMLRDINKDTVPFRPNFDDTEQEPDMLPSRYPNLLVNGASGIAVGLATNIPPHNLDEVISAVLLRIDKPECTLNNIMKYIKGPDFPTGGYVIAGDGLRQAYETGRGKVQLRAKAHIEKLISGKSAIMITEMPYEVKKAALLEKILAVSESKKELFSGIDDIRDESDREGIRAVVEIKRGHDAQKILQLLYKYTDLQITFGINMMAIANGAPRQLSLLEVIDHYILHQKNVVTRRTRFDLEKAEKREHILAGLIIAVKNIDKVIAIIRGAKNLEEAKKGLMKTFNLTGVQAQAILDMRLARLNRLEVTALEKEYKEVTDLINDYRSVLESEKKLMSVIKSELNAIRKKYSDGRRTEIIDETEAALNIDESEFVVKEEFAVVMTVGGLLKRLPQKTLQKGFEGLEIEPKNLPKKILNVNTSQKLYVFTSTGNMYLIPVSNLPDGRLKDGGKQLNALINGVDPGEEILFVTTLDSIKDRSIYFVTNNGFVKGVKGGEFDVKKTRIISTMLKDDDKLIYVEPDIDTASEMLFITGDGMGLRVLKDDIPIMGRTAKGVASVKLNGGAGLVFAGQPYNSGQDILMVTELGYARKYGVDNIAVKGRNVKGQRVFKCDKHTGSIAGAVLSNDSGTITITQSGLDPQPITTYEIPAQANLKQIVTPGSANKVVRLDVSLV